MTRTTMAIVWFLSIAVPASAQEESRTTTPDAVKQVVIEIGCTSVPPHARRWFVSQIESFMAAHPGIRVDTLALVQPLRPTAGRIENLPRLAKNVIGIQGTYGDEVAYLASNKLILPIETFLPDPEFSKEMFFDSAWDSVSFEDRVWGVPWCLDSMWLFYDASIFEEEGIAAPPRTWEEFYEIAVRLTKDRDGDGVIDQWGIRFAPGTHIMTYLWQTMDAQQQNVYMQNQKVTLDRQVTLKHIELLRQWKREGIIDFDLRPSFGQNDAAAPRSAMLIMHNYFHTDRGASAMRMLLRSRNVRACPLPTSGIPGALRGYRYYLAVRPSTPEQEEASWKFIKWINRSDAPWPNYWYGFPCRRDLLDQEHFKKWSSRFCDGFESLLNAMEWSTNPPYPLSPEAPMVISELAYQWQELDAEPLGVVNQLAQQIPSIYVLERPRARLDELIK